MDEQQVFEKRNSLLKIIALAGYLYEKAEREGSEHPLYVI
ncbi:hypothetical protein FHS11_000756 [Mucilaginibacter gotjawali]|uniref:Uncharacterized protein n=1 Tax=Mucilaginibacter gotjawali TaxID=1550579 RepID=A0A839S950_9SPHI|nr:hypothetical protein [Mucilaginibacter gotjawali]